MVKIGSKRPFGPHQQTQHQALILTTTSTAPPKHSATPPTHRHEIQVPLGHSVQPSIPSGGETAQQVEGGGRLVVSLDQAPGRGGARLSCELWAVDDVSPVGGQAHAILLLHVCAAGLGKLACQAAQLHNGHAAAKHHHHAHLQDEAEEVANAVGIELGEGLGAVSALQDEGLAGGGLRQPLLQRAALAGEHQWRVAGNLGACLLQLLLQ